MVDLNKISIRVTALGQRPVIARFGKDPTVALEQRDAMSEFLHAVVQYFGVDTETSFGGGDEQFVLTLRKVPAALLQPATEAGETKLIPPREPSDNMMQMGLYHSSADTEWADVHAIWTNMWDAAFRDDAVVKTDLEAARAARAAPQVPVLEWRHNHLHFNGQSVGWYFRRHKDDTREIWRYDRGGQSDIFDSEAEVKAALERHVRQWLSASGEKA